ncbi:MAG: hypothetical protein QXQ92_03545 [Candidatus Nezhaarchaeales archaeon]
MFPMFIRIYLVRVLLGILPLAKLYGDYGSSESIVKALIEIMDCYKH